MKHLPANQSHYGFTVLILCMLQLTAYRADAQEQALNIYVNNTYNNVNVTGNQSLNTGNITTSFPTGPNGPGGVRAMKINVATIDNGTGSNTGGGPHVRGYTSTIVPNQTLSNQSGNKPKTTRPAAVKAAKPKRIVTATPTLQRPKPKTTITAPGRRVTRPAAPVVAAATAVAAPLTVQVPVSNPVLSTGNESPVIEQVMSDDHNTAQPNVMSDNVSAPPISTASAPAMRRSAASSGSGSSAKSHRSGRKTHGSFYYTTTKKMIRLFAKTRNRKFDPAKCFVWK